VALAATFSFSGSGQLTRELDVSVPVDQVQIGANNFPAVGFDLADGTGNLQAQSWWTDTRTVVAGATDSIDLAGSLTGPLGTAINWTSVRLIVIAINVPDGTKLLQVGPQGVTNAAQLGFGGVGATVYLTTDTFVILPRPYGGWAITAGTADLLPVKNPTAVSVDYTVWIIGTP
jgi:hypothetical protein